MDVQQLIRPATGTSAWSLRGQADPTEFGPLPDAPPWWLEGGSDPVLTTTPVGGEREPRSVSRVLIAASVVVALVLCLAAIVATLAGMRWFVVETPSMGTAAPVGSLVVTRPAEELQRGDIIAFVPPGAPRVYTHRILAIAPDGGITTKGDINGAADGWTIRPDKVLGEAVAVVPGGGYLLRGLPAFLVGAVVLWAATLLIRRRDRRASARVIGLHLLGTLIVLWLHPFVQIVLLATETVGDRMRESIVSTGLLPVRLIDSAGTVLARLEAGRPGVVTLPPASGAADRLVAMPDLSPMLQLVLVGIAVVPALVVMVVGLPREPEVLA